MNPGELFRFLSKNKEALNGLRETDETNDKFIDRLLTIEEWSNQFMNLLSDDAMVRKTLTTFFAQNNKKKNDSNGQQPKKNEPQLKKNEVKNIVEEDNDSEDDDEEDPDVKNATLYDIFGDEPGLIWCSANMAIQKLNDPVMSYKLITKDYEIIY